MAGEPKPPEDAAGSGDERPVDGIEFDEDFVRGAEVKEPSARARMLAEKWRSQAPEPQPWRSDEPPAGWFWSKARRRKRRKR
ncbi:hypothetical protein GT204_27565 [Streptomyces sp. SID4919]|uniref:Uncharacterized protein n=1 Tax=Streptomyces uncialis TaxID=1048205 RepID=A0A1Q4VBH7_9ACTN|nr:MULTISPECIES: hypothetical protein [Streptomyces]MCX4664947.1 hypothetical protein [Streptomyces uncialis]MYY12559.1 hypothetical protein [Streptomyces sp. SID4919]OKH95050.1 hypothetical protein AB852_13095 [Streptomyces uncialis]WST69436.1 hypothetical protein OG268_19280 [Streptomyces uncialis]WTE11902.1 hypothetical protein OG924_17565 [Streptomyces uncialis]